MKGVKGPACRVDRLSMKRPVSGVDGGDKGSSFTFVSGVDGGDKGSSLTFLVALSLSFSSLEICKRGNRNGTFKKALKNDN